MTKPREATTASGKVRLVCSTCGLSHGSYQAASVCCCKLNWVQDLPDMPVGDMPRSEREAFSSAILEVRQPIAETPPIAVKAPELLGKAAALMHERGKTYDEPEGERSMGKAVAAFNAITGRDLTESEGWLLMCVLKAVRAAARKEPHRDSLEDLIAYSALMAEARLVGR